MKPSERMIESPESWHRRYVGAVGTSVLLDLEVLARRGRILQGVSGLLMDLQDLELLIDMDFTGRCLLLEHLLSQAPIVTHVQDLIRGVC